MTTEQRAHAKRILFELLADLSGSSDRHSYRINEILEVPGGFTVTARRALEDAARLYNAAHESITEDLSLTQLIRIVTYAIDSLKPPRIRFAATESYDSLPIFKEDQEPTLLRRVINRMNERCECWNCQEGGYGAFSPGGGA